MLDLDSRDLIELTEG
jgi:hypothetical protein